MSLFHSIIFGPVKSRRLGSSLGINLLPTHIKFCTFNCIYCECGWTEASDVSKAEFYPATVIATALENRLIELKKDNFPVDALTFAGNGEPTTHPEFPEIIESTIRLRDLYAPKAKICVLSNSSMIGNEKIRESLMKITNIMKLDAGSEEVFRCINNPKTHILLKDIVSDLKKFEGNLIIQSMFIRGEIGNKSIDNTETAEVDLWLQYLKEINPTEVMIYSLDRRPPTAKLEKISESELLDIAEKVKAIDLKVSVY
jgi:wyosine [tRNA(Phe)-imidazoG37] synthetase (radical SAM superfamily)